MTVRSSKQQSIRALPFAAAFLSLLLLVGAELLGWFGWVLWIPLPLVSVPLLFERKWGGFFLSFLFVMVAVFFLPLPLFSWFFYGAALMPLLFFRMTIGPRIHKGWQSSLAVLALANGAFGLFALVLLLLTDVGLLSLLPPLKTIGVILLCEVFLLLSDAAIQLFTRFYQKKWRDRLLA